MLLESQFVQVTAFSYFGHNHRRRRRRRSAQLGLKTSSRRRACGRRGASKCLPAPRCSPAPPGPILPRSVPRISGVGSGSACVLGTGGLGGCPQARRLLAWHPLLAGVSWVGLLRGSCHQGAACTATWPSPSCRRRCALTCKKWPSLRAASATAALRRRRALRKPSRRAAWRRR